MQSVWSTPNKLLFGCGTARVVGEKMKELGCRKVLVVCDQGVKAAGIDNKIAGYINNAGIETVGYDRVVADPPDYSIDEAGAFAVAENVDGVVAVGGGSTMDTGKGATVLLTNPPPIRQYFLLPEASPPVNMKPLKPIIVMPTTAGTGSEVTPGGVITDTESNIKRNIYCPIGLGILDPELTLTMPPTLTAATAFDALAHAVEAMTSRTPNRFSEMMGKNAVTLISRYLPVAYRDGNNIEAREGLMLAASQAAMAILGPFCHSPHEIGLHLGATFHISHGISCSFLLGEALQFIAPVVPDKVRLVAECMGADVPESASPEEIGRIALDSVSKLKKEVSLPGLKSFVKSKEELLSVIPGIFQNFSFVFSPRPVTPEAVRDMLEKAYDA